MVNSKLRGTVLKIFGTKYSLTLSTTALKYIENAVQENEIPEDDWQSGLELWAKEYLKSEDPNPLVSLPTLIQAYESLSTKSTSISDDYDLLNQNLPQQLDSYGLPDTDIGMGMGMGDGLDMTDVNVDSGFKLVGAFDMPGWRFDPVRGVFNLPKDKPSLFAPAASRAAFLRERWAIVRQYVLRNENFTPPALGGHDRESYMKLTSTKNLLGRQGQLFLLFGMLSRNMANQLCLEDGEGMVILDMEDAVPGEGIFTENCMVLIEGEYTVEETIRVLAMGHPPCERREEARAIFGHVDFLGIGATPLKDEARLSRIVQAHTDINFVFLSDVYLDHPKTLGNLRKMFEGYSQSEGWRPYAFILCGNFSTKGWTGEGGMENYMAGFKALADLIASFPILSQNAQFIFVPGPTDPWSSNTLPRPPIPDTFVKPILNKVPKAVFTTNPARIRYFNQEIVIFREDLMGRMMRNMVQIKEEAQAVDMKKYLVQTILDQSHLSPLPLQVRPTVWEWDHALRLYPMPTALVLADKYASYTLTYEGCHVFNPGSFVGNQFEWSVYKPYEGVSESSALSDSNE